MTAHAPAVSEETKSSCTNCGNAQVDVFCAHCGEKQPGHHDLTVGHFAHELFHELFHLDSKLFRTLRDLVFRPGVLTAAYFAGRKTRYISPLRMFLTLFAITFLAYSAFKPVAIYSLDGLMSLDPKAQLKEALDKAAAKRKLPVTEIQQRIEVRWQKNMSLSSMLSIVSIAVLLKLLYIRHKRFLAEHLIFGAHYMCFAYLVSLLLWPIPFFVGMKQSAGNSVLMVATFVMSSIYLYLALRRVYGQSGGKVFAKSLIVWIGTFVTSMLLLGGTLVLAIIQVLGA